MIDKKNILAAVGILALAMMISVTLVENSTSDSDASYVSGDGFDLADALDNAKSGDTITLSESTTLSRDATVRSGVTLNDNGMDIRIPQYVTLSIEGTVLSSGKIDVGYRGVLIVANNGGLWINHLEGKSMTVSGSVEVYAGGELNIGLDKSSLFECQGTGRLLVEGTMKLGYGVANSVANVRIMVLTGNVTISDGSSFKIYDSLTIGNIPKLTTDMKNDAKIQGKFILVDSAYVLIYGDSNFTSNNLRYPSVNSQFKFQGMTYATEYRDTSGKKTLVIPNTDNLKDYVIKGWKDAEGNNITADNDILIGSTGYKTITGEAAKRTYLITLTEDPSIRWVVGGITKGSSGVEERAYGESVTINVKLSQGYTELPSIKMDGVPYTAGSSFIVTGDVVFTTSNNYPTPEKDILPTLLAILCILIVVLVMLVIVLKKRDQKK